MNSFAAAGRHSEALHHNEKPKPMLRRVSRRPADYPLKFSQGANDRDRDEILALEKKMNEKKWVLHKSQEAALLYVDRT